MKEHDHEEAPAKSCDAHGHVDAACRGSTPSSPPFATPPSTSPSQPRTLRQEMRGEVCVGMGSVLSCVAVVLPEKQAGIF
jgi:hypothetical protein